MIFHEDKSNPDNQKVAYLNIGQALAKLARLD